MTNDLLMTTLKGWAHESACIDPAAFKCCYYAECIRAEPGLYLASISGTLHAGGGCLMSYVGREFGSTSTAGDFRLVLVGMDHGERTGGDFDDRRARQ
jgi:hypothetical protein